MSDSEKRSSDTETTPLGTPDPGVGARRMDPPPPSGGGRYLDIYNVSEAALAAQMRTQDPRLAELEDIGIRPDWLEIAGILGVDDFLIFWALIDRRFGIDMLCRLKLPKYSRYLKYHRNKRIVELKSAGINKHRIRRIITTEFRENVSIRHIDRILADNRYSINESD